MTIQKTVTIPANRRLTIDVPPEIPEGTTRVIIRFPLPEDSADEASPEEIAEAEAALAAGKPCPLCVKHTDPATGELRYNAETIAAIEETRAMMRGEIPSPTFHSLEELLADLES
jgi:hypothetical protein